MIVSSSKAAELVAVVDRCITLYAGAMIGRLAGKRITEEDIVACILGRGMAGGHADRRPP